MYTDPIADLLTRIRNANQALQPETTMPSSKVKVEITKILTSEGFVDSYRDEAASVGRALTVRLKYGEDRSRILKGIKRISTPGRRVYWGAADITRVKGGIGVSIISTSEGLITDREARKRKIGGEVLCQVW
jgi:small subunit ribosomal protein S8